MSFAALYAHCQSLAVPIKRPELILKICELTKRQDPIRVMVSDDMDITVIYGFIIWPGDTNHAYAKFCGMEPIIVIARGLHAYDQRFVVVKELMHLFDDALERVSTAEEFETLLSEFSVPAPTPPSAAMQSESKAVWMALAAMCPESLRQALQRKREKGEMTDADIADHLKIPQQFVPHLFVPNFKEIVAYLIR